MPSQIIDAASCLQVYLPSALTGGSTSSDPKIRELNNELNEVNRKILNNDLEIPPEGERSPSPEPIYDRNGKSPQAFPWCLQGTTYAAVRSMTDCCQVMSCYQVLRASTHAS